MKKYLSVLLALALLCIPALSVAQVHTEGFPIVDEPIALTGFGTMGPYTKGDFNDLAIWKVMEELTGIKIEFEGAPSAQSSERLGLLFAANTLPDIIFKTTITNPNVTSYAAEGQLVAIDGLLNDYAPNFSTMLAENPAIEKAVTMADGHIYGFPYIVTSSPSNVSPKLFYNAKWTESAGFAPAGTLDEFTEQLRAFKTSDWNGNGQADEIPLSSQSIGGVLNAFYGSYGLLTRGSSSVLWDIDPEGALRFIPTADSYRQMLEYIGSLYSEGLLDQEIFTIDLAGFSAKANQNQVAFGFVHNNNYMEAYKNDFLGLPAPLVGPNGDQLYSAIILSVGSGNTFITSSCKNVEAVLRYIDYFYSDEGRTLFFMGIEGETFYYDEDGNPQFTDFVKANPDGMSMEEALGTYVCWSGGSNPSVADDLHFAVHLVPEITVTAAQNLIPYGPEEIWPANFTYTEEENERLVDLRLDIDTYVTDMRAKYISGSESLDTWDTYVSTLEKMGLDEYRQIVQAGLDRYNQD
ncbi:sugar ABC transporter substrate-binding protein [Clostridia bacterium]|nr:sugar ABC transporter substrate-binding protein [Clostridia bacterium]